MMKKSFLSKMKKIFLCIFIILFVAGCGMALDKDNDDNDQKNPNNEGEVQLPTDENPVEAFSNEYQTILMENIESSDLLLYEKMAYTTIEFNVRDSVLYSAGKDFYYIGFITSSVPEDTFDVYVDYLDEISDQYANEYQMSVEGTINNRAIVVNVVHDFDDSKGGYHVSIRISEEAALFQDENPYFNEYPELVELLDINNQPHYFYKERYDDDFKEYTINYSTSASTDDFVTFYTENYASKSNYQFEEDEYQKRFSWSDSGYDHSIVLQVSNNMVAVYVKNTLP